MKRNRGHQECEAGANDQGGKGAKVDKGNVRRRRPLSSPWSPISHPTSETFTEKNQERSIYPATHETTISEFHSHHPQVPPIISSSQLSFSQHPAARDARRPHANTYRRNHRKLCVPFHRDRTFVAALIRCAAWAFSTQKAWAWPLIHLPALHHVSRLS